MKNLTAGITIFLFFFINTVKAQTIKGVLSDENDKSPLSGSTVRLVNRPDSLHPADSAVAYSTVSDKNGAFIFGNVTPRLYRLSISSSGYGILQMTISVSSKDSVKDLGNIAISKTDKILSDISIVVQVPPVKQKGDTLEYSASQFKVNPDANVEDLIKKMPGVTVDKAGTVTAQGDQVKKVTVDGRDFFGDDATAALRNLPAEIIDKIQVFDKLSDQAAFTGFDDGNSTKTINVVTKANMRNGQFGRMYAGYGVDNNSDSRYSLGGNVSFFKGARRISLVGLFNNINQQNFSSQDLLGVTSSGGGRGGGGGNFGGGAGANRGGGGNTGGGNFGGGQGNFLVGQQNGISKTNAFGINYSDQWGKNLTVTGSYFFNNSNNTNRQITNRQNNPLHPDSSTYYNENTLSSSNNYNNRINMRLEYKIDSFTSIIITPSLNFQKNTSISNILDSTLDNNKAITGLSNNNTNAKTSGYTINNNLLIRHAFRKKGRTLSLGFTTNFNNKSGDTYVDAVNQFFKGLISDSTLQQQYINNTANGYTLSPNLAYTEPVGKKGQVQINYNPSFTQNKADQETFDFDRSGNKYSILDTSLSNKFVSNYNTQNTGISYREGDRDNQLSVGVNYQYSTLTSQQDFPLSTSIHKTFSSILPNIRLRRKLSAKSSINIFLRTSDIAPSVTQLQNVINKSNQLLQSTGNPDLKQQYSSNLVSRYTFTNTLRGESFFANLYISQINDYIANAAFIPRRDSILSVSDTLHAGSQLTKPVNLNGYWNLRSFLTYGMPLKFIKSTFNINGGFTYSKLPGVINNAQTLTQTYTYSGGVVLASNINEYIDFNLSYSGNFNTVAGDPINNYYTSTAEAQVNLLTKAGWFLQNDITNQVYTYKNPSATDQNFWLWNISAGKKFLKGQNGELKLSVFDLLKQNKSISRTVTETYIEDVQSQVLQQYFMLTFTYKLKNFGKPAQRNLNNRRPDGFGPGF